MNLKEFVKNVLLDLDNAVEEARIQMKRDVHFAETGDKRTVEFDIAVTVEDTDTRTGKAGIKVVPFIEGKGDLSKESKNSTVSRIKFGVRISSMTKEEKRRQTEEIERMNEEQKNLYGF